MDASGRARMSARQVGSKTSFAPSPTGPGDARAAAAVRRIGRGEPVFLARRAGALGVDHLEAPRGVFAERCRASADSLLAATPRTPYSAAKSRSGLGRDAAAANSVDCGGWKKPPLSPPEVTLGTPHLELQRPRRVDDVRDGAGTKRVAHVRPPRGCARALATVTKRRRRRDSRALDKRSRVETPSNARSRLHASAPTPRAPRDRCERVRVHHGRVRGREGRRRARLK